MRNSMFLCAVLAVIISTPAHTSEKRIALTFDDAPRGDGPVYTGNQRGAELVSKLEQAKVEQAAFFITTKSLNRPGNRQRVTNYAEAGHLIANHTHNHLWLKKTDTDEYLADIDAAEELLAGMPNRRPWLRFPYLDEGHPLSQRNDVKVALKKRKLMNGYVTVDNFDWHIERRWKQAQDKGHSTDLKALKRVYIDMLVSSAEFFDQIAVDSLGRSPAHILLLHENDVAAMFVGDLVEVLRDKGWTIIGVDDAYQDPIAEMIPETLLTGQGRVAALAVDRGLDVAELTHWGSSEKEIDAALEKHRVFAPGISAQISATE